MRLCLALGFLSSLKGEEVRVNAQVFTCGVGLCLARVEERKCIEEILPVNQQAAITMSDDG